MYLLIYIPIGFTDFAISSQAFFDMQKFSSDLQSKSDTAFSHFDQIWLNTTGGIDICDVPVSIIAG